MCMFSCHQFLINFYFEMDKVIHGCKLPVLCWLLYPLEITEKSIYEGLRRPRWSQFASEIYKEDTIVYGTYNVGT